MINLNLGLTAIVKEVVKKLEEKNKNQEQEKEKLEQEKLEETNLQYILEQNRKKGEKWSKMWE